MPKITDLTADTAPDGSDVVPFVDVSAGATEKVTVDNLAASTAFSGRYKPISGETLWIPASSFIAASGSPSLGLVAGSWPWPAWLFDASLNEVVVATCAIPDSWVTFDEAIYWTNAGGGSGDVSWYAGGSSASDGTDLSGGHAESVYTATAPAASVLEVTPTRTGLTAGTLQKVRYFRYGTDSVDTLANDAAMLGVMLTRAS